MTPKQRRGRAVDAGFAPRRIHVHDESRHKRAATSHASLTGLIRFDRRTRIVLGVLAIFLTVGTLFKLHGSSIGAWNPFFVGRSPQDGILVGTPRVMRIDEWYFATPMIVSQAQVRPAFPIVNPRWGPGEVPLIISMPVRHWSMLIRPQFWGFFILDVERAFAFYWNLKAVLLMGGVFLLLMILTENDFWISLLGASWVFWSAFVQWWYSTNSLLPDMIGCIALASVAVHYLALSSRRRIVAVAGVALVLCLLDFALTFYPPFQVPLFYLGVAIVLGSLSPHLRAIVNADGRFRMACLAASLVVVASLLAAYYSDARTAIGLMRGTTYPGARTSLGGDVTMAQVFSGFYGFFMSEESSPKIWGNVCEASNFVLLFPIPLAVSLWRAWRRVEVSGVEWSLIVYIVLVFEWMTVGWPRVIAAWSGFGLTHETRPLIGLGPASILLCCIFLSRQRADLPQGAIGKAGIVLLLFATIGMFSLDFNRVTTDFATTAQVVLVMVVGATAGYLLLARRRKLFAALVLVPSIWSFVLVNPVAEGLGPLVDNTPALRQVSEIIGRDPDGRWAVYGNVAMANLFKAWGVRVFNGTNYVPPLDDLRILDPSSSAQAVYNRYARIELVPEPGPNITFAVRLQADLYSIRIDPKSDVWPRMGVRYIVLPFAASDPEFLEKTTLVQSLPDIRLWVYRRHG